MRKHRNKLLPRRSIRFFFSTFENAASSFVPPWNFPSKRKLQRVIYDITIHYNIYNQWLSAFSRVGNVAQRLRIYHIFSTKLSNRENAEYAIPFVARYLDAFLYSIFPPCNISLFELNATFSSFFFSLSLFLFFICHRDASD